MIAKKYLFDNKDGQNFCKVWIEAPESANLSQIVESIADSLEDREIMEDLWPADYVYQGEGKYEVTLDVEDVDFSEFED